MPKFLLPRQNIRTQHLPKRLRVESMLRFEVEGKPEDKRAEPGGNPCPNLSPQDKSTVSNTSSTESGRKPCPNFEVEVNPEDKKADPVG